MTRWGEVAAERDLDRLAGIEQRLGRQVGLDAQAGIEERGLVEDLADRVGVVGRRGGQDRDAVLAQQADRRLEVRAAVADVGAEAEVAGRHPGGAPRRRPISSASAVRPDSGRTMTVRSAISPSAFSRTRSMPSTARSPTRAVKTRMLVDPSRRWSV